MAWEVSGYPHPCYIVMDEVVARWPTHWAHIPLSVTVIEIKSVIVEDILNIAR